MFTHSVFKYDLLKEKQLDVQPLHVLDAGHELKASSFLASDLCNGPPQCPSVKKKGALNELMTYSKIYVIM